MTTDCLRCGKPTGDGFVCASDAQGLTVALMAAAGHAEDAWTVIARQARVGAAGGTRQPEPDPVTEADLRRNAVTEFGWQASMERPLAGALRPEPGPADLGASDRLHAIGNTLTTWARHVAEGRNDRTIAHAGADPIVHAARYLASAVDWLRGQPEAGEAFEDLERACADLARLVDRPADRELVGMCDCGKVLYAGGSRTVVQCPTTTCKLVWNVAESRDILRKALRGKLFTAAEAARLAAHWDERTSEQIRKLLNKWAERSRLVPHGQVEGDPSYLFGEVLDELAKSPPRRASVAA